MVVALDFLDDLLHLADLFLPDFLVHLFVLVEELNARGAVAASNAVPDGGELAIVVVEIEVLRES